MMRVCVFTAFLLYVSACASDEKKWVALGDSITYLNDHQDETGKRVTKGYMTRVTERLPGLSYVNKGYNGWTASDVAREIDKLDIPRADVYTVFLGTNDWWRGNPIGEWTDYASNTGSQTLYGAFRIIIDKLRNLNPDAPIVLITPMQRVDFVYIADMNNNAHGSYKERQGQQLGAFATAIANIGQREGLTVIDLYHDSGMTHENLVRFKRLRDPATGEYKDYAWPDFIDIPFDPARDAYPYPPESVQMTYDGLHPSDAGYEVIAKLVVNALEDVL